MFCPECGARQAPDAAFCEQCGHRLAPAAPEPGGRGRTKLVAAGVVAAALAVVAVLALTGTFGGGGHDAQVLRVTAGVHAVEPAEPAPPAVTTDEPPATTPTEATVPQPAAPPKVRSARAVVARTCGRDGVGGDCHLSVRAQPAPDAAELDRLDEGDAVKLSCQVRGPAVYSSALGADSSIWSRTTGGGYVSNVYVTGPKIKARRRTLRAC